MPGNTRTHVARLEKRRLKAYVRDLSEARKVVREALEYARNVLRAPDTDTASGLKAVHAVTQAAMAFSKLIEVGEMEARLTELEEQAKRDKMQPIYNDRFGTLIYSELTTEQLARIATGEPVQQVIFEMLSPGQVAMIEAGTPPWEVAPSLFWRR